MVSFVDSLYLGMSTLMYSASFSRTRMMKVPWLQRKRKKNSQRKKRKKGCQRKETGKCHAWRYSGTVNCHSTRAVFALPYFLSGFFKKVISSQMLIAFIEGVIRLAIFLGYIAIISLTPDIKRTFMYHGSEHKCINCIEHGLPLTVEM